MANIVESRIETWVQRQMDDGFHLDEAFILKYISALRAFVMAGLEEEGLNKYLLISERDLSGTPTFAYAVAYALKLKQRNEDLPF